MGNSKNWEPSDSENITYCHAGKDGECNALHCPQLKEKEPLTTGRHCPLDNENEE